MVDKKPVNVNWQTVFALIPFVNLYAYYRIEKLGRGILLNIAISVISIFAEIFMNIEEVYAVVIGFVIYIAGLVFLIKTVRRWSREWNEKLHSGS